MNFPSCNNLLARSSERKGAGEKWVFMQAGFKPAGQEPGAGVEPCIVSGVGLLRLVVDLMPAKSGKSKELGVDQPMRFNSASLRRRVTPDAGSLFRMQAARSDAQALPWRKLGGSM